MGKEFPELLTIVPDVLVEGFSVLAGKPKIGKSWLALHLAIAVASGEPALGTLPVDSGEVLYLALEDTQKRLKRRLQRMLPAGKQAPERLDLRVKWHRFDKGGLADMEEWLAARERPRLIIIDTLKRLRSKRTGRASAYDEDCDALEGPQQLAGDRGIAMLAVHHTSKRQSADDLFDDISGTLGLNGTADNLLILKRGRGDMEANLYTTGRELEEKLLVLQCGPSLATWTLKGDAATLPPVLTGIAKDLFDLFVRTRQWLRPTEAYQALGCRHKLASIKVTLGRMREMGTLANDGTGRYMLASHDENVL
jgi:hypothetical protein